MPSTNNNNSTYSTYSSLYSLVPNFNPINAIIIRCDILQNEYSAPNDVLFTFNTMNYSYGQNIFIQNQSLSLMKCQSGLKTGFVLSFLDQDFNPLKLIDSNLCIQLIISDDNND